MEDTNLPGINSHNPLIIQSALMPLKPANIFPSQQPGEVKNEIWLSWCLHIHVRVIAQHQCSHSLLKIISLSGITIRIIRKSQIRYRCPQNPQHLFAVCASS